jgi:hypothetical protein
MFLSKYQNAEKITQKETHKQFEKDFKSKVPLNESNENVLVRKRLNSENAR